MHLSECGRLRQEMERRDSDKKQGFISSMIRMIHIAISVDDTHSLLTHSLTHSLALFSCSWENKASLSFIHSFVCLSVCLEESKKHHGEWETLSNPLPFESLILSDALFVALSFCGPCRVLRLTHAAWFCVESWCMVSLCFACSVKKNTHTHIIYCVLLHQAVHGESPVLCIAWQTILLHHRPCRDKQEKQQQHRL